MKWKHFCKKHGTSIKGKQPKWYAHLLELTTDNDRVNIYFNSILIGIKIGHLIKYVIFIMKKIIWEKIS